MMQGSVSRVQGSGVSRPRRALNPKSSILDPLIDLREWLGQRALRISGALANLLACAKRAWELQREREELSSA